MVKLGRRTMVQPGRLFGRVAIALAATTGVLGLASPAVARQGGIVASNCEGCHGKAGAIVTLSPTPASFLPGDDVTFTVTITRPDANLVVGGVFVAQPATGVLRALPGEGLTLVPDFGLTHEEPKAAQGGRVTFRFAWRAPTTPGGVHFDVAALGANGDRRNSGDMAGSARYDAAFGCPAQPFYSDLDRDGFGSSAYDTIIACAGAAPTGYAADDSDCNENDQTIHPGAVEKCNKKDDDCNGEIDENAEPVELWPDEDGDGYYGMMTGTPVIGCVGMSGYAAEWGDCSPRNPAVHRDAVEVCNLLDDDCDGSVDERTRPQCGVGRCVAESITCDPADCTPEAPVPERCNYLDDDCNGEVDDGDLCAAGQTCLAGKCIVSGGGTTGTGGGSAGVPGQGPGAAGGGGGGGGGAGASVPSAGGPPTSAPRKQLEPLSTCQLGRTGAGEAPYPLGALLACLLFLSIRRATASGTWQDQDSEP